MRFHVFVFANDRPTNPAHYFSKKRKQFPLLLGEKAGMRESVKLMWLLLL
jgi:hypothetical protein